MAGTALPYMSSIYGVAPQACGDRTSSRKAKRAETDEVPEFVSRAITLGYDPAGAWALYRRITATSRDVRARRITPAGGARRVDRLALAVAIAKAAGVAS